MGTLAVTVAAAIKSSRVCTKHSDACAPLARFLSIARAATWKNLVELKQDFSAADHVPATSSVIFNIGGKKYRLAATINFSRQQLNVDAVMTHKDYNREEF
jgi:mRNA interferase HigB